MEWWVGDVESLLSSLLKHGSTQLIIDLALPRTYQATFAGTTESSSSLFCVLVMLNHASKKFGMFFYNLSLPPSAPTTPLSTRFLLRPATSRRPSTTHLRTLHSSRQQLLTHTLHVSKSAPKSSDLTCSTFFLSNENFALISSLLTISNLFAAWNRASKPQTISSCSVQHSWHSHSFMHIFFNNPLMVDRN